MPSIRAESTYSSAENLSLFSERVDRFDAFTAVVSLDYPLLDRGGERRRNDALRADAQLLRRNAVDERESVFRETLEAFAALYLAEQRIQVLNAASARATALRKRATNLLARGEISNLTAAQWQDQALATESQLVDLELQRLDAETRLKQLMGDPSSEALRASLDLDQRTEAGEPAATRASLIEARQRLAFEEATAARRPQLMLNAFGGVATVPSTYRTDAEDGTFGIYGLRISLSLPMFDAAAKRRVIEARLQLEEATRVRTLAETASRNRAELLRLAIAAADKRMQLLRDAIAAARQREESVTRLVRAGVRSEGELIDATNAIARRESDLLAARVERWKL
ncbi:MAG TPA: TolC family protein, partial [Thermoanaerobaculia bacterium]|nr:TolC family protein [Thermoanaerobaculia bacterium]